MPGVVGYLSSPRALAVSGSVAFSFIHGSRALDMSNTLQDPESNPLVS